MTTDKLKSQGLINRRGRAGLLSTWSIYKVLGRRKSTITIPIPNEFWYGSVFSYQYVVKHEWGIIQCWILLALSYLSVMAVDVLLQQFLVGHRGISVTVCIRRTVCRTCVLSMTLSVLLLFPFVLWFFAFCLKIWKYIRLDTKGWFFIIQ